MLASVRIVAGRGEFAAALGRGQVEGAVITSKMSPPRSSPAAVIDQELGAQVEGVAVVEAMARARLGVVVIAARVRIVAAARPSARR